MVIVDFADLLHPILLAHVQRLVTGDAAVDGATSGGPLRKAIRARLAPWTVMVRSLEHAGCVRVVIDLVMMMNIRRLA